ncbi:uncharacterized protein LOC120341793 [Styela clava]
MWKRKKSVESTMPIESRYSEVVIPDISFSDYIFKSLRRYGNRVAIIEAGTGRKLTFKDIEIEVLKCASALYKHGVRKGDMVATSAWNSPEYIIVILAAAACGATITTCNPFYTEDELRHQLSDSQPKLVFTVTSSYQKVKNISSTISSIQKICNLGKLDGAETYEDLVKNEDGKDFPTDIQIDPREDILFLPYSSGTTGLPKGVMLTHRNFVSSLVIFKVKTGLSLDCIYTVLPIFHMTGLLITFKALDQGQKHLLDVRFDVEKFLANIEKYKITVDQSASYVLINKYLSA